MNVMLLVEIMLLNGWRTFYNPVQLSYNNVLSPGNSSRLWRLCWETKPSWAVQSL